MTTQISSRLTQALKQHGIEPTPELLRDLSAAVRPESRERGVTAQQKAVNVACAVMGVDPTVNFGRVARMVKALAVGSDYATVAADLETYYGAHVNGQVWHWARDHWLGKKGERPDDNWLRKTWKCWDKPAARIETMPKGWDVLKEWRDER